MTRRLLSLGLLILSLAVLSSALYLDSYLYRGVDYGEHDAPTPRLPGNGMGVNTFLDRETDPESIKRTLEMVRAGGFTWVRQEFPWEDLEPLPGTFERSDTRGGKVSTWSKYDLIVSEADRLGLNLLIRLDRPPAWARQKGLATSRPDSTGPPDDYATFANFVRRVAERYRGRPRYYQIWNEPNLHNEWNDQPIDPAGYVRLLAAAYRAVKEADPQATVVMAGLAPTDQLGPENLNDLIFLERAYQAGLSRYFDVMAVMIYGLGYPPQDRRTDLFRANFSRPALVRSIMERYGDAHKPVIAAEYAWISLPADWTGRPSIWGDSVSEEVQARYLVDGYVRARAEWPWLSTMFVWAFKWPASAPRDPRDPTPYFAIVQPDYRPRPAYHALASYAQHQEWAIGRYTVPATSLSFATYANRIDLIAEETGGAVSAAWRIDGAEGGPVSLAPGRTTIARGLPDGLHLVELTLDRRASAEIDLIRERPLPLGSTTAIAASLLMAAGAAFSLLASLSAPAAKALRIGVGLLLGLRSPGRPFARAVAWAEEVYGHIGRRTVLVIIAGALVSIVVLGSIRQAIPATLLAFAALSCLWPGLGLAGVLASLGFVFRPVDTGAGQFAPAELLAISWVAGGWVRLFLERPANFAMDRNTSSPRAEVWRAHPWTAIVIPGAFLATATLSLLVPPPYWLKYALREYRTVILEPMLVYATMLALGMRLGDLRWLLAGLSAGASVVAGLGIVQYLRGTDLVMAEGAARITSVYRHPNSLALYLDRVLPYGAVLAMTVASRWRLAAFGITGICLAGLVLTFSRGAWIATIAALVVGALALRRSRLALAGALASVALLGILAIMQVARLGDLLQLGSGSASLRMLLWHAAINMIRDHPITGLGLDQFLYYYNPQYVLPGAWEERYTSHAHNLILDLWTRLGIIGVVTGIALLAFLIRTGASALRTAWGTDRWLLVGILSSTAAMLVHGMVDNAFFAVDLAYMFWASYGLAVAIAARSHNAALAPSTSDKGLEVAQN